MYENKECENILFLLMFLTTLYTLAYELSIILSTPMYQYKAILFIQYSQLMPQQGVVYQSGH